MNKPHRYISDHHQLSYNLRVKVKWWRTQEEQNHRCIQVPGERPFNVIKQVFHGDRTAVKTLEQVRVKEIFKCFAYDLYQLVTLDNQRLSESCRQSENLREKQ